MEPVELHKLEREISQWPEVTVEPHRFGGREFLFGKAEIGHVHEGGVVDIPFPRWMRDALIRAHLAEEHRWVPNSGWITFRIRSEDGVAHALRLMRLSYLRYVMKRRPDPSGFVEEQQQVLGPTLAALLQRLVSQRASSELASSSSGASKG